MKKAFTLIELLAVIAILAVVVLITTPIILNVIKNSEKNSFTNSAYGIEKAVKNYMIKNSIEDGEERLSLSVTDPLLEYTGAKPTKGAVYFYADEQFGYYFYRDKYCVYRSYNMDAPEVLEIPEGDCTEILAQNLVPNGTQVFRNNTNFPNLTYEEKGGDQYLYRTSSAIGYRGFTSLIPVDPNLTYEFSMTARSNGSGALYYAGSRHYDIDKKSIGQEHVSWTANTLTFLKQDLKPGDTIVYLNDTTNFSTTVNTWKNNEGFIFWDYQDSTGYLYPPNTYSRNVTGSIFDLTAINKTTHTVTLRAPWTGARISAGTPVSQRNASCGGGYLYNFISNKTIPTTWTTYRATVSGYGCGGTTFRTATRYVDFYFSDNNSGTANTRTEYKDFILTQKR